MSTAAKDKHDRHFSTDHLKSDLKGRSVRAGALTVFTQFARFALNTGTTMVLARMLAPEDFGLVAMLFAIIMFVEMFRDMGLSSATIQRADITHDQVSTLFWINVLFSAIVGGAIFLAAPLLAAFYEQDKLTNIARALAVMFFVGGLNAQHTALLTRQMRFRAQAIVTIISMVLSSVGSILTAYWGFEYWAVVMQYLLLAVGMTIGTWIASGWMPGLPKPGCGVGPMLKYGVNFALFGFVNSFARSMDNVLIGWKFGPAAVGLYSKAYQLVLMPVLQINTPLGRVAMPALSRLQNEPERYRRFYINAVGITTFLGMPIVAFLFVAAEDTIDLLLGHKWIDAVPLFRILGPAAFFGTFNVATGWVYTSLGHTNRQLKWGLITSSVTVIGFAIGLRYGAEGVAAAFSIVYCGLNLGVPGLAYCYRGTPLRLRDAWEALWRPSVTSISAGVALYLIREYAIHMPTHAFPALMIQGVIYCTLYVLAWCLLPDGKKRLLAIVGHVKTMRGGGSEKQTTAAGFPVVVPGDSVAYATKSANPNAEQVVGAV